MKKTILFLNIITLLISCDATNTAKCHKIITFINNTDKSIYVNGSENYPNFEDYKYFPDPQNNSYTTKVDANNSSRNVFPTRGNCHEAIYASSIKSGIMMIYVFDGPTLEKEGWDYIKTNGLVLKRYDLTLKDLQDMNWTITYDGN